MKLQTIKLNTNVQITYKNNGEIEKVISPYDSDNITSKPILYNEEHYNTLLKKISLKEFAHYFQEIHSTYFDKEMYYSLEDGDNWLDVTFLVIGRFHKDEFNLQQLLITECLIGTGGNGGLNATKTQIKEIQKELVNELKILY